MTISINANAVAELAAQQLPNRDLKIFTDQVPQGCFHAADGIVRIAGDSAGAAGRPPQLERQSVHVPRILADQNRRQLP